MRDTLGRGCFHFWCAISLWIMKNKCYLHNDKSSTKMSIDYLGWLYCLFAAFEILCTACLDSRDMEEFFYKPHFSNSDCYNISNPEIVVAKLDTYFSYFNQKNEKFVSPQVETIDQISTIKENSQFELDKEPLEIFKIYNSNPFQQKISNVDFEDKRQDTPNKIDHNMIAQDNSQTKITDYFTKKDKSVVENTIHEQKGVISDTITNYDDFESKQSSKYDSNIEKASNCFSNHNSSSTNYTQKAPSIQDERETYYRDLIKELGLEN